MTATTALLVVAGAQLVVGWHLHAYYLHVRSKNELERLRGWKTEAMTVLDEWEAAWEAAGRPGELGSSKARATAAEIRRLQKDEKHYRRMYSESRHS